MQINTRVTAESAAARFAAAAFEEAAQLIEGFELLDHRVTDVRSVEAGDETFCLLQTEPGEDVATRLGVGGGGQADHWHVREKPSQLAELDILRAEIVPPLRHAVGFIDREQADREVLETIDETEQKVRSSRDSILNIRWETADGGRPKK
mgnify:CR=1 FL=1